MFGKIDLEAIHVGEKMFCGKSYWEKRYLGKSWGEGDIVTCKEWISTGFVIQEILWANGNKPDKLSQSRGR